MVLLLAFGLLLGGYTLLDWGHYRWQSKQVSMWYLLTGIQTDQLTSTPKDTKTLKANTVTGSVPGSSSGSGRPYAQ